MEQDLLTLPGHLSSPPNISGVRVAQTLAFCVVFCRSLFVLSSFFFIVLCLSFFDLRILITPLVSSNSSLNNSISPSCICFVGHYWRILYDINISLDNACIEQHYVYPHNRSIFTIFQFVKI